MLAMNFLWKFLKLVCIVRFYTCNIVILYDLCYSFGVWCYEVCIANIICELNISARNTALILVVMVDSQLLQLSV